MRFREIPLEICVRACLRKIEIFQIAYMKIESFVILGGPAGGSRTLTGAFAPDAGEKERDRERVLEINKEA